MSESAAHSSVATRFIVDYMYETPSGSRTTTKFSASTSQIGPMPMRSETALVGYLQRKHPGCSIIIRNVEWRNMFNETV